MLVRVIQNRGNVLACVLNLGEFSTDGLQDGVPGLDGWEETVHILLVDVSAVVVVSAASRAQTRVVSKGAQWWRLTAAGCEP